MGVGGRGEYRVGGWEGLAYYLLQYIYIPCKNIQNEERETSPAKFGNLVYDVFAKQKNNLRAGLYYSLTHTLHRANSWHMVAQVSLLRSTVCPLREADCFEL